MSAADVTCWSHMTVIFMLLWHECQRQMWPAEVIWRWSSCYCDMNVSGRCDLLKSYDSDLHVTVTWISQHMQMWPAEVILWQWSSCYCDMNVSGRCDLLNKSYDSELHITVTCWYYITRQFILLWQTHTRQRYIGPAAVIWLWSPCCWNWGWNQYSRTDLECFCFVSFSQTTHLIIISK